MKKIISLLLAVLMLFSITAGLGLSVYAEDQRTVSLNAGNGAIESTSVTLDAEGKLPELPVPTRTGWEFIGWYTAEVKENYWGDEEDEKNGQEGVEALRKEYENYFPEASDADWKEMLFSWIIVSDGKEVKAGDQLDEGVATLYAKYKPTTVKVTWNLNGWKKENGIALTGYPQYDSPITALDLTTGKYAWEAHNFDGWYDAAEGGNKWDFSGANGCSTQTLSGDLDLYAHWSGGEETDQIQIRPVKPEGVHPGETFSLMVWYNGITDEKINKPVVTWDYDDEHLELVSTDDLTAVFRALESEDVNNKYPTITVHTANALEASVDITVRHIWNGGRTEKENCIETIVKYTCNYDGCDAVKFVSVPNYGEHTIVQDSAVEPTCTETGKTEGSHCSVCGEIIVAQETVPTIEHSFGEWTEKDGEKTRSCNACGYTETLPIETDDPETQQPAEDETAVDVTNATYVIGSENGASIHFSTPIEELTDVYVNGEPVDKENYTLSEDGTVLTFTSEYLDTLEAGEYEVTLLSASGSVSTKLTVEKADEETTSQGSAEENVSDEETEETTTDEAITQKPTEESTSDETTTQKPTDQTAPTEETTSDKETQKPTEQSAQAEKAPAQDKADKNGASTSPSTGADSKGLIAFAAIAIAGGAVVIIKKKEQD